MNKYLLSLVVILPMLIGCSSGKKDEVMNAEFSSLNKCLDGIKRNSKQSLRIITDKPTQVSGKLSNGKHFACERASSGTKGVYFKGWYKI